MDVFAHKRRRRIDGTQITNGRLDSEIVSGFELKGLHSKIPRLMDRPVPGILEHDSRPGALGPAGKQRPYRIDKDRHLLVS